MFKGSLVALVTPFCEDGSLDTDRFKKIVAWQIEQGSDGLVICGSTGESPTLSPLEQKILIEIAVRESRGRIPIIAGTGTNDTRTTIERTIQAKEAGVDGCLVIVPYYNRPTFEGCFIHFEKVTECGLPTIIYHHPGRTGVRFSPKELAEICDLSGVMGLKEAGGNIENASEFMKLSSKFLFSGDDNLSLPLITAGAKGVISVLGNLFPKEWAEFIKEALKGDLQKAEELYLALTPISEALSLETNPQCIKYAMSLDKRCSPFLRLPLLVPKEKTREQIEAAYQAFNLLRR